MSTEFRIYVHHSTKCGFSKKAFPYVLLICYHHLGTKLWMYIALYIFLNFWQVWPWPNPQGRRWQKFEPSPCDASPFLFFSTIYLFLFICSQLSLMSPRPDLKSLNNDIMTPTQPKKEAWQKFVPSPCDASPSSSILKRSNTSEETTSNGGK